MAAHCRICQSINGSGGDPLVACNNCGSLVCDQHHTWWSNSKNAFCTECFPTKASGALTDSASALESIQEKDFIKNIFYESINASLLEKNLNIEDLKQLMILIATKIKELENTHKNRLVEFRS